jgi:alpha-galactosidase
MGAILANRSFRSAILFSLGLCLCVVAARAQTRTQANFAQRPYMGWSSWSRFHDQIDESLIKGQADALIASRLPAAGYRYINMDDGWSNGFDDHGIPMANPATFPTGIKALSTYLHQRGLLFGIYLNPGISEKLYKQNPRIAGTSSHIADITDVSAPGSTRRQSYRIDFSKPAASTYIRSQVKQFAGWGVDFVKMDFVGPGGGNIPADDREEMRQWHLALSHASRPIWLELSNWLSFDQAALWRTTSNGWRIENDIECYECDNATSVRKGNLTEWSKVAERFRDVVRWIPYAGPGGWNDLDTLELGNGDRDGLTPDERQSMFLLWSINCAPLYLGSDLTKMDADDLALITKKDIIAIDQAGVPARPLDIQHLRKKQQQVWMTQSKDGTVVFTFFNLDQNASTVTIAWSEVDALRNTHLAAGGKLHCTNLMDNASVTPDAAGLTVALTAHGSRILRVSPGDH